MVDRLSGTQVDQDPAAADAAVDVAVIGAGLAGLTAALTACRAGATVRLFDAGRPGGRARSSTVDPGVVFNRGPRGLYAGGAAARELAALGVSWRGGSPLVAGARALRDGQVHVMPSGPSQLLRTELLGVRAKVQVGRLLGTVGRRDPRALAGRTVSEWIADLGLTDDAAALVRAVVRLSTYVDDPSRLDAGAVVAQLQLALGDGVRYLDHGWQTLVDQLVDLAVDAGVEVEPHSTVGRVRPHPSAAGWALDAGGRTVHAGSVVLATGTPAAAADLCPVALPVDAVGPPVTAACLELAVRGTPPTSFLLGIDEPLYLSQHAPPATLAPEGISVVHVLRYGATEADRDRAALWAHAAAAGVDRDRVVADRFLARMVVTGGAPLASAGGLSGRPPVRVAGADGVHLAGDWVGDEGMLADAAVSSGAAAGRAAAHAASAGRGAPVGALGTGW